MPYSEQLNRSEAGAFLHESSVSSSVYQAPTDNISCATPSAIAPPAPTPIGDSSTLETDQPPCHQQQPSQQSASPQVRATVDITVAIPTYNGADRLPMVLDKLRSQTHLKNISWEVIVCDNSSTDDTATVVRAYQADWPENSPLHYRFAAEQGAAFARQRAVESAKGNLIAFLDDDNLPAEDWLSQAVAFAKAHPKAGAFGSQIHGQFESDLPAELENIKCFLAIIERGDQPHLYAPANKILPPAAGLVVRKSAWLSAVPPRLFLNNKGKEAGLASEDLEALLHIQKAGHEIWYNPAMVVHHDIPDGRLRKDYLVTLFRCVGLSRFHIRLLGLESWKRPAAIPAYIANDICKLALHRLRYGSRQQLSTTQTCDRTLLTSTVISPFFLLKKAYKDAVHTQANQRHSHHRQQLDQLTQAFEQNQFTLYQQPIVRVGHSTAVVAGHKELLLRLNTRQNNCVLPQEFLPTAQHYQLMQTLDRWVIRQVVNHVVQVHGEQQPVALTQPVALKKIAPAYAINLAAQSVQDPKLASFITTQLSRANLPAHWFCFEIDSSLTNIATQPVSDLIAALHDAGCHVTLDNITINPETIHQLKYLNVDYIKLDPAFLAKLQGNRRNRQTTEFWATIQAMLKNSDVEVIAKNIESKAQLEIAQAQGIRYAQGYKMAKPQPL